MKTFIQILSIVFLISILSQSVYGQGGDNVSPEKLGFSSAKLEQMDSVIQSHIDKKELAGVVTLIARYGEIVHFKTYGYHDIENKINIQKNSIFRLASVAKIFAGVAALICYEEDLFLLDDPVKKYIPEFSNLRVLVSAQNENATDSLKTEPLKRDITIRDLLRHTAGFLYGFEDSPIAKLYNDAGLGSWDRSLKKFVEKLTEFPLAYQPGTKWRYSYSTDVVGRIIEIVTQQPLDAFMKERIFDPLQMYDTGFFVPENKLDRLTNYYEYKDGALQLMENAENSPFRNRPSALSAGGGWSDGYGGLVSTAADFSRLLQMILNYGELNNKRILSRESVELLITNQVHDIQDKSFLSSTFGYGIGVGVSHKENSGPTTGITWTGGPYNTRYWIDFENNIYGIFLTQTGPWGHLGIMYRFGDLTYKALLK